MCFFVQKAQSVYLFDLCVKKRGGRNKLNTWWWNREVSAVISGKKAHVAMYRNSTGENSDGYNGMMNKARKVVSKSIRKKAVS